MVVQILLHQMDYKEDPPGKVKTYIVLLYTVSTNKPKGLKVAKEELRSIGLMVDRLDG